MEPNQAQRGGRGMRLLTNEPRSLAEIMADNEPGTGAAVLEDAPPITQPVAPPITQPAGAPTTPRAEPVATATSQPAGAPAAPRAEPRAAPRAEPQPATSSFSDKSGQTFNILDEDFSSNLFAEPAEPFTDENSEPETVDADFTEETPRNSQPGRTIPIEPAQPAFSGSDLKQFAKFGVELLDGFASMGLSFFAGEGRPKEYEMDGDKKKLLIEQLGCILERRNLGGAMSFELMFIITFAMAYIPAFESAFKRRKQRAKLEELGELPEENETPLRVTKRRGKIR